MGDVAIAAGAELDLQGGIKLNGAGGMTLAGAGVAGAGALNSYGGDNGVSGSILLAGPTTMRSGAAGHTLSLGAVTDAAASPSGAFLWASEYADICAPVVGTSPAGSSLTFVGPGNVAISSLTLAAPTTINSSVANLSIGSVQSYVNGPGVTLTFTGPGNVSLLAGGGTLNLNGGGLTNAGSGTLGIGLGGLPPGTVAVNGGKLLVDWSNTTNTQFIYQTNSSSLELGGGAFELSEVPGAKAMAQIIQFTAVNAGASTVSFDSNATSSNISVLDCGALIRSAGGTLNLNLPSVGNITASTPNNNGILGGWATVGGTDWAANSGVLNTINIPNYGPVKFGNNILALSAGGYTADSWGPATNTTVTSASNSTATSGLVTNSLRFDDTTTADTVTLSSTSSANPNTIVTGGILVSSAVGGLNETITGGYLTTGNGDDLIVNQFGSGTLTISSIIVDDGPSGLTLSGGGALILCGANTYSGPTYINAGILICGTVDTIPTASALHLAAGATWALNGFNQSIGSLTGTGNIADNSRQNATLTVGSDNSSPPAFSGVLSDTTTNTTGTLALAKIGSGTLTLTGANTYSGGTIITGGILNINSDSALGRTTANPNITFNGSAAATATLQLSGGYSGTSLASGRNIAVTAGASGTIDTNGNNITYGGVAALANSATLTKAGDGTFEIDAPPALGNGSALIAAGGSLRLNYSNSPTIGTGVTVTIASGGTLELAGAASQLSQAVNVVNNSLAPSGGLLVSSLANQNAETITGSGSTIVAAGASLTTYQIVQNSLTIHGTGTTAATAGSVTLVPSGSGSTTNPTGPNNINFSSTLTALSIDNNGAPLGSRVYYGTLDIGNNGLVIAYGSGADPYTQIDDMIRSGFDSAHWDGTGITSSLARAAANSRTPLNIGLLDFTPGLRGDGTFIVFEGQTVTTDAILLRLTYMDDVNSIGDMSLQNAASDALLFAANYGVGTTWSVGDLTHDGAINAADALLFAANYATGLPSLDGSTGNEVAIGGSTAAVPEPSSIILAALGMGLLVRHRRMRRLAGAGD